MSPKIRGLTHSDNLKTKRSSNNALIHKLAFSLVLLVSVCSAFANVDNVRFIPFETDERTSIPAVTSIHQDSTGYMWFGTQEGINRYNGYDIEYFTAGENDDNEISSSRVSDILEDDSRNIWIATYNGLAVYSKATQKFSTYTPQSHPDVIGNPIVDVMIRTIDSDVWFATEGGLSRFIYSEQQFKSYNAKLEAIGSPRIWSLATDVAGGVWMGTKNRGLLYYNPMTDSISQLPITFDNADKMFSINFLKFGADQILYIGTSQQEFYTLDIKQPVTDSGKLRTRHLSEFDNRRVRELIVAKNGVTWVATNNGLFYKAPTSDRFGVLVRNVNDRYSLLDSNIVDIYLDNSNVLWVATARGLNRWNASTSRFDHYRTNGQNQYKLSNPNTTAISQLDEDILFIANYEGLDVISKQSQSVTTLKAIENEPNSLASNRVMSVYAENKNSIWIGYRASGLSRYDLENGTFKHYRHNPDDPSSLGRNAVTSIIKDSKGRLWFGTFNGGLSLYLPATDTFKTYRHDPEDIYSISSNRILSVYEDSSGLLWLGTMNEGVNIFNPETGVAARAQYSATDKESISSNSILTVHEDPNKNIWIGTHGGGLNLLKHADRDRGRLTFTRFRRGQGLLSDVIYAVLSDKEDNVWFSSNKGITKLKTQSYEMTNFNTSHGLQGNEFNSGAHFVSNEGEFYFGGSNGVTAFYPEDIQPNANKPNVVLTAFNRLNQKEKLNVYDGAYPAVEATYKDYLLSFEFAALDYAAPQFNEYAYKLVGFDSDWISAKDIKQATYTNLPAGQYTFRVRASNSDGVWNEAGASIELKVLPPPWETWWAYLSYICSSGMAFVYILYRRKKRLERKATYLKTLEDSVLARTSELSEANKQLRKVSTTDHLTGLHNRLYLNENIKSRCDKITRRCKELLDAGHLDSLAIDGPRLCCLMFDLDGFKPINDNHGHSAGDKVIIEVAQLLRSICKSNDIVARWGGDEFIIIANIESLEEIKALAEDLRTAIAQYDFNIAADKPVKVSSSIGFALYPFSYQKLDALSWDQIHTLADKALYLSKEAGKNTWTGIVNGSASPEVNKNSFVISDIVESEQSGYVSILRPTSARTEHKTYEAET